MFDQVENLSKSLVQHGPNNDRVYLMKIHPEEKVEHLIDQLDALASQKQYGKIFAKVPKRVLQAFLAQGFTLEATVPDLYAGQEEGCFLGKYLNAERGALSEKEKVQINDVKEAALSGQGAQDAPAFALPEAYEVVSLAHDDVAAIAEIYKQVFQFYPFPIFETSYLLETMRSHVQYFGVRHEGELMAVSSAEMDVASGNVEMTDFATLPEYRGKNLSYFLLERMVGSMREEGLKTAYTIARSVSFGMNKTFARQGFHFGGILVKNTLIGDSIESMNVWYRPL